MGKASGAARTSRGGIPRRPEAVWLPALLVAAAALAAGLGPDAAYAQGGGSSECQPNIVGDCVYDVTRSFHVGDIEPWVIREDSRTGLVYVANVPHTASKDQGHSHLRIYDSYENDHKLIKDIRFNGTNSRIVDFEINSHTRELHVLHMWGVGDRSEGWNEAAWNGDGKASLTTINITTHEITGEVGLRHGERSPDNSGVNPVLRYLAQDLALDEGRDIAYVSNRNADDGAGPILAVNTSDTSLLYAVVTTNRIQGSHNWDAYDVGAGTSAMAVDQATGTVYAAVRVGDEDGLRPLYVGAGNGRYNLVDGGLVGVGAGSGNYSTVGAYSWGIAALSFGEKGSPANPHYSLKTFLNLTSNPAPSNSTDRCKRDYELYPCNGDVLVEDMQLDTKRKTLFALYGNHTVWAFRLNGSGGFSGEPMRVDVRDGDNDGKSHDDDRIHGMALDEERGLLYVVLYDFADPRVAVINVDGEFGTYPVIGTASLASQPVGIGLDAESGTVYALPQWSPHAYVIEAKHKSDLQKAIDVADAGSTINVTAGPHDDKVLRIKKPLTLTSAAGEPGDVVFTGHSRIEIEANNTTVRGLVFRGTDCMPGYGAPSIEIRTRHDASLENIAIVNNEFLNTCHAAIQQEGVAAIKGIEIRGNVLENVGLGLPPGETEPLDTGGENEFQISHGGIGLAHHHSQGTVGGVIADNRIAGTSAAGIRVFNADGLAITGNYIANTPASAVGLAHSAKNVLVFNNTIVGANSEPDLDYLAGVNGSGEPGYYRFLNLDEQEADLHLGFPPYHSSDSNRTGHDFGEFEKGAIPWRNGTAIPSPDAAINVWSHAGNENITITGNTISGSDGALTVCTGVCGFESDGLVKPRSRDIAPIAGDSRNPISTGDQISFTGNTVYAYSGPDNGGVQVRSHANGTLDASGNEFVGCGMGGEPVQTAGRVNNGLAVYVDGGCAYHVTRTLAVGDIIPEMVRVHNGTGHVYVANRPHLGTADQNYSHLRIYDSYENGHKPIKDIRFNGTNSRISDIEINYAANDIYVAHMWGVGDRSAGWDGAAWNGDGRANLTRIDVDSEYAVNGTIALFHGDVSAGGGPAANYTRDIVRDLALDEARDRAYVSTERRGPVLAVDTSGDEMRLLYTSFNGTAGSGGGWNAYAVGAPASALAVDDTTGRVYAAVRTGDRDDAAPHSWGIATLSFDGDGGALTPNYTRSHFLNLTSNRGMLVEDLLLDAGRNKLFALYDDHKVWAFDLNGGGAVSNSRMVDVRAGDPPPAVYGEVGHPPTVHNRIGGIALDAGGGLLYASLYDFANPRVAVIDADTHKRVGLASASSQIDGLGLDARTGAVYALPQWTPNAYVIEAAPRPALQGMVDNARPGATITLLPGTHNGTVLDVTNPLTIEPVGGEAGPVVFTGYSRIEVEADNVALRGLSFEDTACMPGFAGSLVEIRTYHDRTRSNVTVESSVFRDTCHAAIQQEGTGGIENIRIAGNTFEGIGLKNATGRSEPLDTGGENEFQLFHGAIGLAFHPSQKPVGGTISGNTIDGTSAAGIRVFNADGMEISNNIIRNTPASAIGLAHGPSNVSVTKNTIEDANNEPNLDYLDGVNGSSAPVVTSKSFCTLRSRPRWEALA